MQVKVKSGKVGFIGGKLRNEGEVLKIEESQFSSNWMEKLEESKPENQEVETKKTKK